MADEFDRFRQPAGSVDEFAEFRSPLAPAVEEMHPDITTGQRGLIMNLSPTSEVGAEYLRKNLGFQVVDEGNFVYKVRKPGEKEWKRLDPAGFDWRDILDIGGDVASGVASGLAGGATLVGTAPALGLGAIPASMAVAGAAGAGASGLKSALGGALGLPVTGEAALEGAKGEALTGAVGEGLGVGAGYALRAAKPLASHLGSVVRALPKVPGAAARAAVGAAKALPEATVNAAKSTLQIPVAGPFANTLLRGAKKGWQEGMGKVAMEVPEETKAILKTGLESGKLPGEVLKEAQIPLEALPARPAVQETAKKAMAGEPLEEFEQRILGRAIDTVRDPGAVTLTPGEQYLEHLYWQQGAKGSNREPGANFFIEWARRGPGKPNPLARIGDRPGDVVERFVKMRPSFMTRQEVRATTTGYTDDELRQVLRDDWGIKGWRRGRGADAEKTPFIAPVPQTQKRVLGGLHPLEETTRGDLEELLFRVQPEAITLGKGGTYDPRKYKLSRFIDLTKAEPFGGMSKDELVAKVTSKLGIPQEQAEKMSRLALRNIWFGPRRKYMGLQTSSELESWISSGLDDIRSVKIPEPKVPGEPTKYRKITKEEMEALGKQMFGG